MGKEFEDRSLPDGKAIYFRLANGYFEGVVSHHHRKSEPIRDH